MAKLSLKQREAKREELVAKYAKKYAELKAVANDAKKSDEERYLARLELQVLYTQILSRLPRFRLDAGLPVTFHAGNIIAFDSLPIRWD